jgi:site-specific recombinase XerD
VRSDLEKETLKVLTETLERNSAAANTVKGYRSDWESWLVFCSQEGARPLPAEPDCVCRYLAQLVELGGRKGKVLRPKTVERHLAAIAAAHRAANLAFNTANPILKKLLTGIRQHYGKPQQSVQALRPEDISKICETFSLDLRSVRNKAIILLGFAGGFRRSEIVALNVEDLTFSKGEMTVALRRLKGSQQMKPRMLTIRSGTGARICPIAAVQAWLRAAEIENAGNYPLFRAINRWGAVELGRLSDKSVDRIVKELCRLSGLKTKGYSAKSLCVHKDAMNWMVRGNSFVLVG